MKTTSEKHYPRLGACFSRGPPFHGPDGWDNGVLPCATRELASLGLPCPRDGKGGEPSRSPSDCTPMDSQLPSTSLAKGLFWLLLAFSRADRTAPIKAIRRMPTSDSPAQGTSRKTPSHLQRRLQEGPFSEVQAPAAS